MINLQFLTQALNDVVKNSEERAGQVVLGGCRYWVCAYGWQQKVYNISKKLIWLDREL